MTTTRNSSSKKAGTRTANKNTKKRAYSKTYSKTWAELKNKLIDTEKLIETNDDNIIIKRLGIKIKEDVLSEMRDFTDYKFTNTGKRCK